MFLSCLILRYIDNKNNVHEQFVGFINCHDYAFHNEKNILELDTAEHEKQLNSESNFI